MEYTVMKLGRLAGVSARTLRYYDEIGLLKPVRVSTSGYRVYGQAEVDRLQQILFYRELDVGLDEIGKLLSDPQYDAVEALKAHRRKLCENRDRLGRLIGNIDKTIAMKEGGITMTDAERFEGFKQNLIDENEKQYGKEVREKYGNERVDKSNEKLKGMSEAQYAAAQQLGDDLINTLGRALKSGDPSGKLAQETADMHRRWLSYYWDAYSGEAHLGLAQMYVDDERFRAYYNKAGSGAAVFLRDAVKIYTEKRGEY